MLESTWETIGTVVAALSAGVAYGCYSQEEWGYLAMSGATLALGLFVAYVGFRARLSAQLEGQRLEVMLENLKTEHRRSLASLASLKGRQDSNSHGSRVPP